MTLRSTLRRLLARVRLSWSCGERECLREAVRLFDTATEDVIHVARQRKVLEK